MKKKCDQKIKQVKLVKKGKAQVEEETVRETICNADIKETKEIPEELCLFEKWDSDTIKAFMTQQTPENLKVEFIKTLQHHMNKLHLEVEDLKSGVDQLIRNQAE